MEAISLVSKFHTTELVINQPINHFVGDLGSKKWSLHIKKCVPAAVNALIAHDYSLSMTEYGLCVDKY